MTQSEFIQSVRQSIANGETEEALDVLQEKISDFDESLLSDITLLGSRFKSAQSDCIIKGILPREDYDRTVAQINYAILEILEKIEKSTYTHQGGNKDKSSGRILHNIPGIMPLAKETRCIVRIAYDDEALTRGFNTTADTVIESVRISEVMGVELVDFNEIPAFQIRTITEEEQFLACDDFTQWIFQVKPLLEGKYPLTLKVTVIEKIDGRERKRDIVLEKEIFIISQSVVVPQAAPVPASPAPQASSSASNYQIGFEETNLRLNYVASDQEAAVATVAEPAKKRVSTAIVSAVATVIFAITGLLVYQNSNVMKEGHDVVTIDPNEKNAQSPERRTDTLSLEIPKLDSKQDDIAATPTPNDPIMEDDEASMSPPPTEEDNKAALPPVKKKVLTKKKAPKKKYQDIAVKEAPKPPLAPNISEKIESEDESSNSAGETPDDELGELKSYKVRIKVKDEMVNAEILVNDEKPSRVKKNLLGTPQYIEFQSRKKRQTFTFKTSTLTCKVENIEITGPEMVIEACNLKKVK